MLLLVFGQGENEKGKLVFLLLAPSSSAFYLNVFFLLITFRHLLKFQFIPSSATPCRSSPSGNITVENASLCLYHFHCLPLCVALLLFPVLPNISAILLVPETINSCDLHILLSSHCAPNLSLPPLSHLSVLLHFSSHTMGDFIDGSVLFCPGYLCQPLPR